MNTIDSAIPARTTRHYTDREKLQALNLLACCNGNLREAARTADIPWTTLRSWSQQYEDQYAAYCNTVRGDVNTVDRVELPELGGLLTDLESKADLLIAQITPERLADVPLTHVARLLTSILPRIESMRKVAAAREYARARSKTYRDIVYIVQRLIPDPALRQQIHDEFARLNSPQLLEPDEDDNDNPEPSPTTNATATPSAVSEQTDTQELASESSLSRESIREMDDSDEGGLPHTCDTGWGVGETAAQRENAISERSASTTCCVNERAAHDNHQEHPDSNYRHPLPLERGTSTTFTHL
jgi:hypothetical protein